MATTSTGPGGQEAIGGQGVVYQRVLDAGVLQPHRQVGAAFTGGDDGGLLEVFEPDVPQPGQVLAVGHLPVDGDHHPRRVLVHHRQRFLPAGWVLGQQDPRVVLADPHRAVTPGDFVDGGNRR